MAYRESTPERRARLLGSRIKGQVDSAIHQMKSHSDRPPFHDQQTPREALAFWTKHRYDAVGQKVLAALTPLQVAQLDAWLTAATQTTNPQLQPNQPARQLPGGDTLYNQALSSEKRIEGPPLGPEVA